MCIHMHVYIYVYRRQNMYVWYVCLNVFTYMYVSACIGAQFCCRVRRKRGLGGPAPRLCAFGFQPRA